MFEAILKGLGFGLLLSISVGPVLFSIIKQSLNNGPRGGFAFILGVSASDISLLVGNIFTELLTVKQYKTEMSWWVVCFWFQWGSTFKKISNDRENRYSSKEMPRFSFRLFHEYPESHTFSGLHQRRGCLYCESPDHRFHYLFMLDAGYRCTESIAGWQIRNG
jgi:hypothetical protein